MSVTDMPAGATARKVYGATGGATLGAVTYGLVLGLLEDYVFAPDSVPGYLSAFLLVAINGGFAYAGGWLTKRGTDEVGPPVDLRPVRPVEPEYGEH